MSTFDLEEREAIAEFGRAWWVFLLTGILWFLVAIIILRFDYTSVSAISILFGIVAIFAGINEFMMLAASGGWWKVLHGLLGVLFIVVGIVAFVHPGDTFAALAAVFSFFLIFKGFFDIVVSIATRDEIHVWWLQLIVGIVEVLIGFWAAGYWGRSAILLVVWVGVIALARGITEIIFAFKLRSVGKAAAASRTAGLRPRPEPWTTRPSARARARLAATLARLEPHQAVVSSPTATAPAPALPRATSSR